MTIKIISGGQTGVDRAALDVALELGLACGGWCPLGRRAEDGAIPECYPLRETTSAEYAQRTQANVRDSDATLIVTRGPLDGGTALTQRLARERDKPCLVVDLDQPVDAADIRAWFEENHVSVLNVAGPRESSQPGIQARAISWLRPVLIDFSCVS